MKNLILTLIITIIFSSSFSQNLELYFEGELLEPNEEITIIAHPDSGTIVFDSLGVKNISSTEMDVLVKKVIIDTIPTTTNDFCWGSCYPSFVYVATYPVTIGPGDIYHEFAGHYSPNGIEGKSKIMYVFFDMNSPDDSVSVIVDYNATTSGVIDNYCNCSISNAYPNPANSFTSLNYDMNGVKNARLVIYNFLGSVVKEIEITNSYGNLKVNTSDFDEGIYFYSLLINNKALKTQKLIINH
ncbi:MAG: T9SS type A sorting domain-containing protein [Bacteroidales bacterium]|nr:T9SS type A sorting domain-containing protein [Bacteroidales bacterium]